MTAQGDQFSGYLSPGQQDLLFQALTSNDQPGANGNPKSATPKRSSTRTSQAYDLDMNSVQNPNGMALNPNFFGSPQQQLQTPQSSHFGGSIHIDESPFVDYLEPDANFDFEPIEDGAAMIGGLPNDDDVDDDDQDGNDGELHEKRKSIDDDGDNDSGEPKRQEGEDKVAKKPGRKPLTTEPTTKRKAQNRAAQRAFRERKEKHLKDLETKVKELEDKSKSTNQENGLLRAQVSRLQTELREYKKRISLNASGASRSPPASMSGNYAAKNGVTNPNDFNFNFPRFGTLPGAHIFGSAAQQQSPSPIQPPGASDLPGVLMRQQSDPRSHSPRSKAGGTPTNDNNIQASMDSARSQSTSSLDGIFSPSILKGAGSDTTLGYFGDAGQLNGTGTSMDANTGPSPRVFRFNASSVVSVSNTDSPESCSTTYNGNTASTCTSPDVGHNSPPVIKENTFAGNDSLAFTEYNKANPTSSINGVINDNLAPLNDFSAGKSPANMLNGIDWFASQNGGAFDPVLFGDYRESQDAIIGGGDFTGGFFSDAFNMATPNFGTDLSPPPQTQHDKLLETIDKVQNGTDEEERKVAPAAASQMLDCNNLWNKLQDNKDFQDGKIDIDDLCSELRAKARCSESGVVVDPKAVDELLAKETKPRSKRAQT